MKAKLDREFLVEKLSKLMKFVPSSAVVPAYESIMLTVSGDKAKITACDGADQCTIYLNRVKADSDFSICIPAKLFFKTVSLFRENDVTIKVKENRLELSSGKSKYNITMDCEPNSFPLISAISENFSNSMTMIQGNLKMALSSSRKFVDEENSVTAYTVMNLSEVDKKFVTTATSGVMICRVAIQPLSIENWSPVRINIDTAKKVVSMLEEKGEITIAHNESKVLFSSPQGENYFEIMSCAANSKFPDTERFFSKKPESSFEVNTIEFSDAIRRLKLYSETGIAPQFNVEVGEVEAVLTSADKMTGRDGEDIISISENKCHGLKKIFNSDQVLQILSSIDTDNTLVMMSEQSNMPTFFKPKVFTKEEDMFDFLVASINLP